jgi:methyl coenzyme M reductase subunit C-like uncharacterized protein (methanogenesis marker protein 7)
MNAIEEHFFKYPVTTSFFQRKENSQGDVWFVMQIEPILPEGAMIIIPKEMFDGAKEDVNLVVVDSNKNTHVLEDSTNTVKGKKCKMPMSGAYIALVPRDFV